MSWEYIKEPYRVKENQWYAITKTYSRQQKEEKVMAIVDLTPASERIMEQLRPIVSPKKAAAISAILMAEEQLTIPLQTTKMHAAIEWLVQEICDVDPRTGLKIKAQIEALLKQAREAAPTIKTLSSLGNQIEGPEEYYNPQVDPDLDKYWADPKPRSEASSLSTEDQQRALEQFRRERDGQIADPDEFPNAE